MAKRQGTNPWTYVGIGCLVVTGIAVILFVGIGILSYRWVQETRQTLTDPDRRAEKIRELLGTEALPEGYHPNFAITLPLVAEVAVLSDREASDDPEPDFDERGFIYASVRDFGGQREKLRDFVEGRTDENEFLDGIHVDVDIDLDMDEGDPLSQGGFSLPQGQLTFVSYRAVTRPRRRGRRLRHESVAALFSVECETDKRLKLGIWFGPDPSAEAAAEEAGEVPEPAEEGQGEGAGTLDPILAGTPADPAALEAFVSNFRFCGQ